MRLFLLLLLCITACQPQAKSNQTDDTSSPKDEVLSTNVNDDGSISALAKASEGTQTLTAPLGPTAGTEITFPPGSLAVDMNISIAPAKDLTTIDVGSALVAASNAVSIEGAGEILKPFTISIVLTESLSLVQSSVAVAYKNKSGTGLIKEVTVKDGRAYFESPFFGTFQVVTIKEQKQTVAAPKKNKEPADFTVALGGSSFILQTATCSTSDIVDPDGDVITKSFVIEVSNGAAFEPVSTTPSYVIKVSDFEKTLRCSVTASDGNGWIKTFSSQAVAVQIPARSINLSNYIVRVGDSISCFQNIGTPIWEFSSNGYSWTGAGSTTDISVTSSHSKGYLRCKASDAVGTLTSPVAEVVNTPPNAFTSTISNASPVVGDTVACQGSTTDADNDGLTYTYRWFVGSTSNPTTLLGSSSALVLNSSHAHKYLRCQATAFDGSDTVMGGLSPVIQVGNSAPVIATSPSVVNDSGGSIFVGSTAKCERSASDVDGDTLSYSYVWKANGAALPGKTSQTMPVTASEAHKSLSCSLSVSDGYVSVSADSSSTSVANSTPTVSSFGCGTSAYLNSGASLASIGACSITWSDADGDNPSYSVTGDCPSVAVASPSNSGFSVGSNQIVDDCSFTVSVNDGKGSSDVTATTSVYVKYFSSATVGTPVLDSSCAVEVPLTLETKDGALTRTAEALGFNGTGSSHSVAWANAAAGVYSLTGTGGFTLDPAASLGNRTITYSVTSNHGAVTASRNVVVGTTLKLKKPTTANSLTGGEGRQAEFDDSVCSGSCSGNRASLSVSARHACVVDSGGGVKCWGKSNNLSLGGGSSDANETIYGPRPVLDTSLNAISASVVAVAGGNNASEHSCSITATAEVVCWGRATRGQTGYGDLTNQLADSVCSNGESYPCSNHLSNVSAVTLSDLSSCAVSSGEVFCWGAGDSYQLGAGNTTDADIATNVKTDASTNLASVVSVASGNAFYCALSSSGDVHCWGDNTSGQLGSSPSASGYAAVVHGVSGVLQISAGGSTACGLTSSGVYCWGRGTSGQLGNGTTANSATPVFVTGSANAVSVTVGDEHACFLDKDGKTFCWGKNVDGRLGKGDTTSSNTPVAVVASGQAANGAALTSVVAVSAGVSNTCYLTAAGEILCSGSGVDGVVGTSAPATNPAPVAVTGTGAGKQNCPQYEIQ